MTTVNKHDSRTIRDKCLFFLKGTEVAATATIKLAGSLSAVKCMGRLMTGFCFTAFASIQPLCNRRSYIIKFVHIYNINITYNITGSSGRVIIRSRYGRKINRY